MRTILIVAVFATALQAQTSAQDNLNLGVTAFRNGNYPEAVSRFKAAVALDPHSQNALLYLGTAYVQQYVSGVETEENRGYATAAIEIFRTVLQTDPANKLATQSLASLYYNLKDFRSAVEWNHNVLAIDPSNKEAYYTLGVISWTEFIGPDREARNHEQMRPEDPPPLRDPAERAALKARFWQPLTEGIENENKALAIDPTYENAMAYLNLLIRYRADLDDSKEQAQADLKEADNWVEKALKTLKEKSARTAQNPHPH